MDQQQVMENLAAKIFLNEQRGAIAGAGRLRQCTFNFESFFNVHKAAFGDLYLWNEEVLAGGERLEMELDQPSYLILIPVTGGLVYTDAYGSGTAVGVGQVLVSRLPEGGRFGVQNPYPDEEIYFIQVRISARGSSSVLSLQLSDFELAEALPEMIEIGGTDGSTTGPLPFKLSIGQFAGREEIIYQTRQASKGVFCFVIAGAFEIQGRLLQPKDGLALWDLPSVELEALSNNALLLMVELF